MWTNNDNDAAMKFHEATPEWFSTWDGTTSAMQVGGIGLRHFFLFFVFLASDAFAPRLADGCVAETFPAWLLAGVTLRCLEHGDNFAGL